MSNVNLNDVRPWVANRIVDFFNQAQSISEITRTVQDDPSDGPGNAIGRTVARRILEARNKTPWRRFNAIEQIFAVDGMGQDKLDDLVYTLGTSAAQAFVDSMYDNQVISRENWPLQFFSTYIESKEEFESLFFDPEKYRAQVIKQLEAACKEEGVEDQKCQKALDAMATAYIDSYNNTAAEDPAYEMAQWFFRIDLGNFFFYETGIPQTLKYFSYHQGNPWEMELRMFKGVRAPFTKGGLLPSDLATVANVPEQVITIWFTELFD